jgi:hypothetical protein
MDKNHRQDPPAETAANASKRARLDALLFNGAKVGTALLSLAISAGPKTPPWQGE